MRKQSKSQIVRAEIVALDRGQQAEQFKLMITQAIEKHVSEALSSNDSIFQPFFQSQSVAHEIKRRQTVAEQQKYVNRFKKWGCLVCQTKDRLHKSLSMCAPCYNREAMRLQEVVREHSVRDTARPSFMDTVRIARRALAPSIKILAGTSTGSGTTDVEESAKVSLSAARYRSQKEAAQEVGIDRGTLTDWITSGKVRRPAKKLSATKWLWSDEDIERLRAVAGRETERTRDPHGRFSLESLQEKTANRRRNK